MTARAKTGQAAGQVHCNIFIIMHVAYTLLPRVSDAVYPMCSLSVWLVNFMAASLLFAPAFAVNPAATLVSCRWCLHASGVNV